MTPEDFDALFDALHESAFRLEALPQYRVGGAEQERLNAYLNGRPLPERSVRTQPWVARLAVSTVTAGISWSRVRVVDEPPTDYQRYQLESSYRESQAVGEQIRVVSRSAVGEVGPDFWLLDAGTEWASAVVMRYDDDGRWLGADLVTDPATVAELDARRTAVTEVAVPLNEFLAAARAR